MDVRNLEKILKALANKRRILIIQFLAKEKEANVGEITEKIKLSYKATSKHLGVLYSAELVEREQRSLEMYYCLSKIKHPILNLISNSRE